MNCSKLKGPLQVRCPQESGEPIAPSGSEGQREFLQERISLFARATLLATLGFWIAGFAIAALWPARASRIPLSIGDPSVLFHLAAVAVFLVMTLVSGMKGLPEMALRAVDSVGTITALWLFACMASSMPVGWRPEMLDLLILSSILLYRAANIPSEPRRTAVISAISVLPVPFVAYALYAHEAPPATSRGAAVAYSVLWSSLTVVLATLMSYVTFRLRSSVAKARRLGQYTLGEKLGEGGMGVVYRAEHEMLRRPTAIKLLPPERAGEHNLKRFEREVQLTARLTNPHTVSVYDFGRTPDGVFYYVMEYLDGIDLEDLVKEGGPVDPGRAVRILRQICAALGEAHGIGLIHRDIKPANIILCERGGIPDIAKVLDFGLVRDMTSVNDVRLTAENVIHGTPQYLAPETIRNAATVDARSDLYAVGAVAYFLLTGTPVFTGRGALELIHHHLQTEPEAPSKRLGKPLPPKLEAVVLSCLAKDPDQRPESAKALADALKACDDVPAWDETAARGYWRERALRRNAAKTA
jgi:serine/threonine-protein kinase